MNDFISANIAGVMKIAQSSFVRCVMSHVWHPETCLRMGIQERTPLLDDIRQNFSSRFYMPKLLRKKYRQGPLESGHIARVVEASKVLAVSAWKNYDATEDTAVWAAFQGLKAIVLQDSRIDFAEQLVMLAFRESVLGDAYSPSGGESFFDYLIDGKRITDETATYVADQSSVGCHMTEQLPYYWNRGRTAQVTEARPTPEGYVALSRSDPRLRNRYTWGVCYGLALLEMPVTFSYSLMLQEFSRQYRRVDLATEPSKIGDVVAYFDTTIGIPHMAFVSQVDPAGRPLRVISKFGDTDHIYEHPIDRAPLAYGIWWGVFRTKL